MTASPNGRMRGSANEAFVDGSPDDVTWGWRLGAEQHCEDCPEMADGSSYTKDTLFSYPGDGSTECLGNCGCVLERSDGVLGFPRAHLEGDGDGVDDGEEGGSGAPATGYKLPPPAVEDSDAPEGVTRVSATFNLAGMKPDTANTQKLFTAAHEVGHAI